MTRPELHIRPDPGAVPGRVRLIVPALEGIAGVRDFSLRRHGFTDTYLGPVGWQRDSHWFPGDAAHENGTDLVLVLGPSQTSWMDPMPYELVLRAEDGRLHDPLTLLWTRPEAVPGPETTGSIETISATPEPASGPTPPVGPRADESRPREAWGKFRILLAAALLALALFVSIYLAGCHGATSRPSQPALLPLWEVTTSDSGSPGLWLLGSVHLRGEDETRLDAAIVAAFRNAEGLAVELDPQHHTAEIGALVTAHGVYPDGSTALDHLPEELGQRLREVLGGSPDGANLGTQPLRPWLLALTLVMDRLRECRQSPETGVDQLLLTAARGHKTILELESPEEQIRALADVPDRSQIAMLADTLNGLDGMCAEVDQLAVAWGRGDMAGVEELIVDRFNRDPDLTPYRKALFGDRNRRMADRAEDLLARGSPHLLVVGAGHMVGQDGLLALLRQRGYGVRQVPATGNLVPATLE